MSNTHSAPKRGLAPSHRPAFLSRVALALLPLAVLAFAPTATAVVLINDIELTVALDNTVTITFQGTKLLFGAVGNAGDFPLINGWGISSGEIVWQEYNGQIEEVLTLNASGVHVPVSNRVSTGDGAFPGFVNFTASPVLGSLLRAARIGGVQPFRVAIAQGDIPYEVSGTATIPRFEATLINNMSLFVDPLQNTVTVNSGGTPLAFGPAGAAGTSSWQGGWRVVSGDLTWRNTLGQNVATLFTPGLNVVAAGLSANSARTYGSIELGGTATLAVALTNEYGPGTSAFKSLAVKSPTTDFYLEGFVTVPEPGAGLMVGACAIGVLAACRRLARK